MPEPDRHELPLGAAPLSSLNYEERYAVEHAPLAYQRGLELQKWWREKTRSGSLAESFELVTQTDRPGKAFGFLDSAPVDGKSQPVFGESERQFFDRPHTAPGVRKAPIDWTRNQLREYALRYFFRTTSFRTSSAAPYLPAAREKPLFPRLSACNTGDTARDGIGFYQLAYKKKGGEVAAIPQAQRSAVVDARELGPTYDWVLLRADMYKFALVVQPFGETVVSLALAPPDQHLYVLMTPNFVVDESPNGGTEWVGEYGLGFSIVENPTSKAVFDGPQNFNFGIQFFRFKVKTNGEIWVEMVFIANQIPHLVSVSLNPVNWSLKLADTLSMGTLSPLVKPAERMLDRIPGWDTKVDLVFDSVRLLNQATMGRAARNYCISVNAIQRSLLVQHEQVFYKMIADAIWTWRQIPDWTASDLPAWVVKGEPELAGY